MHTKDMAKIFKRAWQIHDASWNEKTGRYNLGVRDALELSVKEAGQPVEFAFPMYLALQAWPNDVMDWCEEILKGEF